MGFWVAAARLYPTVEVGRDTVLISVMIELSTVCQLNMGNGIARFLPDLGDTAHEPWAPCTDSPGRSRSWWDSVCTRCSSPVASIGLPGRGNDTGGGLRRDARAMGAFTLQDAALTATRQAPWIPVKNGLFGALKLVALPALARCRALSNGVFLAWALPMALLLIPVNLLVFRRAIPAHRPVGTRESSIARIGPRRVVRFLAQDYLASVFTQATLTVLPLLVIAILGATAECVLRDAVHDRAGV